MDILKFTIPKEEVDKIKNSGILEVNGVEYIRKDHVVHILEKWKQKAGDVEKQPDTESKCNKHIVSVPKGTVCEYCKEPNSPSGQCTNLMCTNYLNGEQTAR